MALTRVPHQGFVPPPPSAQKLHDLVCRFNHRPSQRKFLGTKNEPHPVCPVTAVRDIHLSDQHLPLRATQPLPLPAPWLMTRPLSHVVSTAHFVPMPFPLGSMPSIEIIVRPMKSPSNQIKWWKSSDGFTVVPQQRIWSSSRCCGSGRGSTSVLASGRFDDSQKARKAKERKLQESSHGLQEMDDNLKSHQTPKVNPILGKRVNPDQHE